MAGQDSGAAVHLDELPVELMDKVLGYLDPASRLNFCLSQRQQLVHLTPDALQRNRCTFKKHMTELCVALKSTGRPTVVHLSWQGGPKQLDVLLCGVEYEHQSIHYSADGAADYKAISLPDLDSAISQLCDIVQYPNMMVAVQLHVNTSLWVGRPYANPLIHGGDPEVLEAIRELDSYFSDLVHAAYFAFTQPVLLLDVIGRERMASHSMRALGWAIITAIDHIFVSPGTRATGNTFRRLSVALLYSFFLNPDAASAALLSTGMHHSVAALRETMTDDGLRERMTALKAAGIATEVSSMTAAQAAEVIGAELDLVMSRGLVLQDRLAACIKQFNAKKLQQWECLSWTPAPVAH